MTRMTRMEKSAGTNGLGFIRVIRVICGQIIYPPRLTPGSADPTFGAELR